MQCIQNDVIVNFNDIIRIVHCALNIESTQTVTFLTFEWTFLYKNRHRNMSMVPVSGKMK